MRTARNADRIDLTIVSTTSAFAGRVRITGVLRNVGGAAYNSSPGQQSLALYQDPIGLTSVTPVAIQTFEDVPVGAEVSVSWERDWNSSSPNEGEFPPNYRILILYDPDILLDGNTENDDSDLTNNSLTLNGSNVNDLF